MKKALQLHGEPKRAKRKPSADEVTEYLENFRALVDPRQKSPTKLISIKVEVPLLEAFKMKARLEGSRYQSKIKELMRAWLATVE